MEGRKDGSMTARIIGAVLVIVGCGGLGMLIASNHRQQTKTLRRLIMTLDLVECELQYRQTPLPDLCKIAAQSNCGTLRTIFLDLSTELEKQISPSVEECMAAVIQTRTDVPKIIEECFLLLGQSLGKFDMEGQLKGLMATKSMCQRMLERQTDNQDVRIRCYQTLSICAGAALAILLI